MNHNTTLKLIAVLVLLSIAPTRLCFAYDFSAVAPTGQTLYYNVSNGMAQVTNEGYFGYNIYYSTYPTGNLIIPDTVSYNGIAYPVKTIEILAFSGCTGLTSVSIPNTVYYIGGNAFEGCTGLTSITIPELANYVCAGAFYGCSGLTSVVFQNSMLTIAQGLFAGCTSLTSITIGSSITRIESDAFEDCVNLTSIYLLCNNPPQLYSNAFFSSSGVTPLPHTATFYVKCGTTSAYQTAWATDYTFSENWIPYELNLEVNDTNMGNVTVNVTACGQGTATATANPGYYFDHWNDGNNQNPRLMTFSSDTTVVAFFATDSNVVFIHDTIYVNNHDTTYIHDTTTVTEYVHDTTIVTEYAYIHDTTTVTEYIEVHDTVWQTMTDTVWLTLYDTVWLHDTVIVHDTIYITQEGIGDVAESSIKLYQKNGQIVMEGAAGKAVYMYDINGRLLMRRTENEERRTFDVPVSGAYLIKVGELPARKIVVIR